LLQYLAFGKPVVATSLPEVARFGDLVYLAGDHDTYVQQFQMALAEGANNAMVEERKQAARAWTWDANVERLDRILFDYQRLHWKADIVDSGER
jgi:glycosyltransferase involved in cell wall biosynthesis